MNHVRRPVPQQSFLFRLVAFFSRHQLSYLLRNSRHRRLLQLLFVFVAGATALGIISILAFMTNLPLLFPQLGPSAFILFYTPMSEQSSPRNVLLSHLLGVGIGLLSLWLCAQAFPGVHLTDSSVLNWQREIVVACSMGLACLLMVIFKCVHPPAAASALIASLGYLNSPEHVLGIVAAVVLLLFAALFFNRVIGGLPYPLWKFDAKVARHFGEMAGIPANEITFWRQAAMKTFQSRRS
ncbi:MAG: HPP family protein [Desulfuromonadaceae bacterium]|nr:HPP family protein [Desulfuromonadaceae bacterium]